MTPIEFHHCPPLLFLDIICPRSAAAWCTSFMQNPALSGRRTSEKYSLMQSLPPEENLIEGLTLNCREQTLFSFYLNTKNIFQAAHANFIIALQAGRKKLDTFSNTSNQQFERNIFHINNIILT